MPGWQKADVRGVAWGIHSEFDGLLMCRFRVDISKLAHIRRERREPFRSGDDCQVNYWSLRAVCENSCCCRSLVSGQVFWVEDYLERAIRIRLDDPRGRDFGVTASCVNPLDVEW